MEQLYKGNLKLTNVRVLQMFLIFRLPYMDNHKGIYSRPEDVTMQCMILSSLKILSLSFMINGGVA